MGPWQVETHADSRSGLPALWRQTGAARAGLVGDCASRSPPAPPGAPLPRAVAGGLVSVDRPGGAVLRLVESHPGVVSGAVGRDVPGVSRSTELFRVPGHDLRRLGPDRRRSSRQRAPGLPLQAAHPDRVHHRETRDAGRRASGRDVGPGDAVIAPADDVRGKRGISARQPVPVSRHHGVLRGSGARLGDCDAGVVGAHERAADSSPSCTAASSSSPRPCIRR